jgi:putative colanic acid biosynthesis acetyltransferase WcaF
MPNEQIVNPDQTSAFESPWSNGQRALRALWEFCWFVFCQWTPKPFNPWRPFWLRVFEAKIEGTPFVHSRARIAIRSNLTLHDRACLGDRANA